MFNIFDIPGLWNLIWIVPLAAVTGFGLYGLFGMRFSRKPEGPPYATFDDRLDAVVGDRDFVSGGYFGEPQHGRTFGPDAEIPEDFGEGLHPGLPCGPQCWAPPNGHRRGI